MDSRRPYRQPLAPEAIRQELLKHRGTQFDSDVVAAFLEIFDTTIGERGLEGIPTNVVPFRICNP